MMDLGDYMWQKIMETLKGRMMILCAYVYFHVDYYYILVAK